MGREGCRDELGEELLLESSPLAYALLEAIRAVSWLGQRI